MSENFLLFSGITEISMILEKKQMNLTNISSGPSQGLKIRGARSIVVGIICFPWLR